MINYELLPVLSLSKNDTILRHHDLPELVHFEDSALTVLIDFYQATACTIKDTVNMDEAIHDMDLHDVQLLLVIDADHNVLGLLTSEDVLGEKPIQYIHQQRLAREQVLVHMLMTSIDEIPAMTFETVKKARIGHIIKTMHTLNTSIALVVSEEQDKKILVGAFTTAQMSKQLHHNVR